MFTTGCLELDLLPLPGTGGPAVGGASAVAEPGGRRTLRPRTGPPIIAFGEGRAGVICVLLLAIRAALGPASLGDAGCVMAPSPLGSLAEAGGALVVGAIVLDRSTPAERGPSIGSVKAN